MSEAKKEAMIIQKEGLSNLDKPLQKYNNIFCYYGLLCKKMNFLWTSVQRLWTSVQRLWTSVQKVKEKIHFKPFLNATFKKLKKRVRYIKIY